MSQKAAAIKVDLPKSCLLAARAATDLLPAGSLSPEFSKEPS